MTFTLPSDIGSRHVAVIGGGTLGRRIAAVFASGGTRVVLMNPGAERRAEAAAYVAQTMPEYTRGLARQGIHAVPGELETTGSLPDAVRGAWLVVEAVPERLELKQSLFAELDSLADRDALLATNSSSFTSRLLVGDVRHRERVFNMHFTMPPRMMTVELMSDGETSEGLLDAVAARLQRHGLRVFIAQRESTGFIFNRIWAAVKRESLEVVASGVSTPRDVDEIMKAVLGMHVGPFELMDRTGLDVILDVENHYAAGNPHLPEGPRTLLRRYVDAGKLGCKTGEGFYKY